MNKAETRVIQQAALLARDVLDDTSTDGDRNLRLLCLIHAVHSLSEYRKRNKKSAKKTARTTGVLPANHYSRSVPKYL